MRFHKVVALVLAVLDLSCLIASLAPKQGPSFKAVIQPPRNERREGPSKGKRLVFRSYAPPREPATKKTIVAVPPSAPAEEAAEIPIDAHAFLYMGRMNKEDTGDVFFVKEKSTNRVYTIGKSGSQGSLISIDDSRIVFEIGGQRYEVEP